jgi:mediator of RNA polymerase II transcription subunit 12
MPLKWSRYASTLKDLVKGELGVIESQARCVFARNEQIAKGTQQPLSTTQHTSRHKLISILDRASEEPDFAKLSNSCFEAVTNHDLLVTTAIEWGTTPFRTFAPRTYLALRLLRHWLGRGVNVEKPLMALLSNGLAIGKLDADRLYKLISGLIRSGHFSIGKYLQWIIATGCLTSPERYDIVSLYQRGDGGVSERC